MDRAHRDVQIIHQQGGIPGIVAARDSATTWFPLSDAPSAGLDP
jgi:hypothetical protein